MKCMYEFIWFCFQTFIFPDFAACWWFKKPREPLQRHATGSTGFLRSFWNDQGGWEFWDQFSTRGCCFLNLLLQCRKKYSFCNPFGRWRKSMEEYGMDEYGRVRNSIDSIDFEFASKGWFSKLHGCRQEVARGQCAAGSVDLKRCEDGDMEAFKRRRSTELKNGRGPQKNSKTFCYNVKLAFANPNLDHSTMSNQIKGTLWEPTALNHDRFWGIIVEILGVQTKRQDLVVVHYGTMRSDCRSMQNVDVWVSIGYLFAC